MKGKDISAMLRMQPTTPTSLSVLMKGNAQQGTTPASSVGQVVSFASYYQTSFRIEVPLWHKVEDGLTLPGKEHQGVPDNVPSPISSSEAVVDPLQGADQAAEDADEEETE